MLDAPACAVEKRIAVFVGLCDNATQGIVKVGAKIGGGDKPDDNLYWGCSDGLKSHFKASCSPRGVFGARAVTLPIKTPRP